MTQENLYLHSDSVCYFKKTNCNYFETSEMKVGIPFSAYFPLFSATTQFRTRRAGLSEVNCKGLNPVDIFVASKYLLYVYFKIQRFFFYRFNATG